MKRILGLPLVIVFMLSLLLTVTAQERKIDVYEPGEQARSFYVEAGGPGFISANYDFRFNKTRNGWGMRAGLGYFGADGDNFFTVPLQVNYLIGKRGHYFETGAGISYIRNSYEQYVNWHGSGYYATEPVVDNHILGSLTFGYRKQPVDGGFMFRVGLSPILYDGDFIPYLPYISFGYSF